MLCRPSEFVRCTIQLGFADRFLLKLAFAEQQEVAGGVVLGVGVTSDGGLASREQVAVEVDGHVIGDLDPPVLVSVMALMLTQPGDDLRLSPSTTALWCRVIRLMV